MTYLGGLYDWLLSFCVSFSLLLELGQFTNTIRRMRPLQIKWWTAESFGTKIDNLRDLRGCFPKALVMFGRCRFHLLPSQSEIPVGAGGWVSRIVACGLSGMFGFSVIFGIDGSEIPKKHTVWMCRFKPLAIDTGTKYHPSRSIWKSGRWCWSQGPRRRQAWKRREAVVWSINKFTSSNIMLWNHELYMDVSENSGFSPQTIHFNRVFHYKPSILGYPYFWKHPYRFFSQMVSLKFKNSCNCSTFHTSLGIAVPSGLVNFFWPPGSASFAYRTALGISLAQIQSSIRSK